MGTRDASRKIVVALATEELCKTKHLRNITVPEICEKAGLSKTSFYRLFNDKYDVALWIQSIPLVKGVGECGRTLTCEQGVAVTLQGQMLFKNLYLQAANAGEVLSPDEQARISSASMLRETIEQYHHQEVDDELDFMVDWLSISGREMVKKWLRDDKGRDVQTIAKYIADCCPARLRDILDNPITPSETESIDFQRFMLMALER